MTQSVQVNSILTFQFPVCECVCSVAAISVLKLLISQSLLLAAIIMNIPESSNRSFEEFEHMMQQPHVFRNQTRATIGKGKKAGKAECQEKAECPRKGSLGKGKGRARDKNQIFRTYYAPMEDTRQARGNDKQN